MSELPLPENGFTAERYFALVDEGRLDPDDRVELLEGVVVAMAPQSPRHASAVSRLNEALRAAVAPDACVRSQLPVVLSGNSVPEPDAAVVPGHLGDYDSAHPRTALLVAEVSGRSLPQDRITKARIYAAAGIPEYWIVNLRAECVEVLREPLPTQRAYATRSIARRGDRIELVAVPGATVAVDELLPIAD